MPRIAPPPPVQTADELSVYATSQLLLKVASHAATCLNRCAYCTSWLAEIDRRVPPRTA